MYIVPCRIQFDGMALRCLLWLLHNTVISLWQSFVTAELASLCTTRYSIINNKSSRIEDSARRPAACAGCRPVEGSNGNNTHTYIQNSFGLVNFTCPAAYLFLLRFESIVRSPRPPFLPGGCEGVAGWYEERTPGVLHLPCSLLQYTPGVSTKPQ